MDPAERVGVCEVDRLDKDGEITAGQDADLPSALTGSGLHGRQSLSGRLITDVAFGDKGEQDQRVASTIDYGNKNQNGLDFSRCSKRFECFSILHSLLIDG